MYYGYDIGHEIISGKVLTYEIKYNIPYVKIAIEFMYKNNSHFQTSIGYSQIVDVEDYDNHILRSKRSRGECEGDAILFSLSGRYCFINNLFFTLQFDYITVEAEGRQKQRQDGIYIGSIDQKITSKQKFLSFESGYRF